MFGFGLPELIVLLFTLTPLVLWVVALVDIIRSEFSGNNKIIWILVVLLLPLLGAILYFLVGRKQKVTPGFGSVAASGRRFCSECGEEVNPRAEICPKCGVRQQVQQKSGSNALAIILVIVLVGTGSIAVVGIMAAIAIPQFSAYRLKAYDSAALSDLKNAKTAIESYYADKQKYPVTLDQAAGTTPSVGVTVLYERDKEGYVLTAVHKRR